MPPHLAVSSGRSDPSEGQAGLPAPHRCHVDASLCRPHGGLPGPLYLCWGHAAIMLGAPADILGEFSIQTRGKMRDCPWITTGYLSTPTSSMVCVSGDILFLAFGQALSVPGLKSILGCHSRFHNQARSIENTLSVTWTCGHCVICGFPSPSVGLNPLPQGGGSS